MTENGRSGRTNKEEQLSKEGFAVLIFFKPWKWREEDDLGEIYGLSER